MKNRSLFLIKPDAMARGLRETIVGEIVADGFIILWSATIQLDEVTVRSYQPVMNDGDRGKSGKNWRQEVLNAQTNGLSEILIVEREDALRAAQALKSRIRSAYAPGDHYQQRIVNNLLHTPDTEQELELNWRALIPDCTALFNDTESAPKHPG